ncbi:lytic murein transglycosylase [Oceanicoccus sp. KOV_DT_Chl]|uniref:lytic murein transglycosylase n=1 Tax=Oceanicoccus sp. KOV_DT_Chl TaxID=1904639 RepID=UPI001F293C1B|nr:lytic murein transglycosylase [Oceanicoccus sp. KOV_DT_Chl]
MLNNIYRQRYILITWLILSLFSMKGIAESFSQCLDRLQIEAKQRGLADNLIADLGAVKPLERTIQYDRSQPEFVQTFADYFTRRVTDYHVRRGRELMVEHELLLNDLAKRYGVPAQYLVSFWGLETNFGRHIGKMPILDTLATLACDERRSQFFTEELFLALELMAKHKINAKAMQGSWAGAIGQTQFLPSAYMKFGIDGDGDGRVDLWRSTDDALTSAAYYLQQLGWQPSLRWGREVQLPSHFPYHRAGVGSFQTLGEWQQLGVEQADGKALADLDIDAELLIPAGAEGPKFLIYQNFHVIMKWNRSQFYALSVGHLADRINGAGKLSQPPLLIPPLTKEQISLLQAELKGLGFDPGEVDGQLGSLTRAAIRNFQQSKNLQADGFADVELLQSLGIVSSSE